MTRLSTYRDYVGELTATYKRTKAPTTTIKSAEDAADFIRPYFDDVMDDHEIVMVIHLNNNNQVVNVHKASQGGLIGTVVPVNLILQQALIIKTKNLIMVHNHPSGQLKFSTADIEVSKKLKKACEYCDLTLLDSLILTRESYLSITNEGLI